MKESELILNWGEQKISHNYKRIMASFETDFEFIGHVGHPSSYAYVRFIAEPADEISLEFSVDWPQSFDEDYTLRIEHSIGEAVLDVLFPKLKGSPWRGCALRLTGFKWDEVGGSEMSVYRATTKAMEHLCAKGQWSEITGKYRQYRK
jgi:hypothetical protein